MLISQKLNPIFNQEIHAKQIRTISASINLETKIKQQNLISRIFVSSLREIKYKYIPRGLTLTLITTL